MNAPHPKGFEKCKAGMPDENDHSADQAECRDLEIGKALDLLHMMGANYALLYKKNSDRVQLFTHEDRPTEPRKKVEPESFKRVADAFNSGRYDGIALIKDGAVLKLLPGGRLEQNSPALVDQTGSDLLEEPFIGQAAARFTRLRYTEPIGKLYFTDSAGQLQKQNLATRTSAVAHIVDIRSIEELAQEFRNASSADILVGGVPHSDQLLVTTKQSKRNAGEIARSKDDLPFPNGPGVMFLDNDRPAGGGDDQFNVYIQAVPALASASYVFAPSSSAWIYETSSGKELKGAGGQHYAIPVVDATDIPRALKALHRRLILAGIGTPFVTKSGAVLIKSPVDLAMQTPNQPLFQRVVLNEGLDQRKEEHIGSHRGGVFFFDSRLISDLTADEQVRLAEITDELQKRVEIEAQQTRQQWIEARADAVASINNISRAAASECLHAALMNGAPSARFDLVPGIQIKFSSGWVDVGELLASPWKYDGLSCADPLEPDYGSGVGVAKFYANPTGKPAINSHAHGGQTFFLHPDPNEIDLSGILAQFCGTPVPRASNVANAAVDGPLAEEGPDAVLDRQTNESSTAPGAEGLDEGSEGTLRSIEEVTVWTPTVTKIPLHLETFPTEVLNGYLTWFNQCVESTVTAISVLSVIHLACFVCARGAKTDMRNYTSLYLLLIAPSGFGKNYGKDAVFRILYAAGIDIHRTIDFFTKGGVYSAMTSSPTAVFHLDEFGEKIGLGLKSASDMSGAFSYVKEVYSACDSVISPASYSTVLLSKKQTENIRPVKQPCINFFCLTTPGQLWDAINNASVEGGFLNRFVGVMAEGGMRTANKSPTFDPPEQLVTYLKRVRQSLAGEGDLGEQKFVNCDIEPNLAEYIFDEESRRLLNEFKREITQAGEFDDFMLNMMMRWRENAMRMALALHVFSTPENKIIDALVTQWCIDYVRFFGAQFANAVLEHSSPKSEYGRLRRDFLQAFRRRPQGTAPSELGSRAPWKNANPNLRATIIQDLLSAGLIGRVRIFV